jgi:hypothetical protein
MKFWAASRIVPLERGSDTSWRVGLDVGPDSHPTELTEHTSNRKGSATR